MNENDKDWGNPVVARIYGALAQADLHGGGGRVNRWLNENGFANLTCCPECHVDDFTHVEGCMLGEAVDAITDLVEKHKPEVGPEMVEVIEKMKEKFRRRYRGTR